MTTCVAVLQVCGRAMPCHSSSQPYFSKTQSDSTTVIRYRKKSGANRSKSLKCAITSGHSIFIFSPVSCILRGNVVTKQIRNVKIKCQRTESASGISSEGGNGAWFVDNAKEFSTINGNTPNVLESKELSSNKEVTSSGNFPDNGPSRDTLQTVISDSIEDEAWELLRQAIVYYCGNPVGTMAAQELSSSSVLNYDQVFIRDFIPSGIAFLLKGEYDLVCNFILHTLQLQSWEKTMDCHSPGQGLMPASFKVRTVPLEGDDLATEEILDPDFGEAAIGRIAPVDSGLWWIILLRAYGKCTGDLSLQERIDVQTGIKMILRLCLADGFDMFPTLLVTDGSCMIDRCMGIHGHPLDIQLTAACIKMDRPEIAARAVEVAEKRISKDKWPEYYDVKRARFIGKQARLYQTWSIMGYLVARLLLSDPSAAKILITEEDSDLINAFSCAISSNPRRNRGPKSSQKSYIV